MRCGLREVVAEAWHEYCELHSIDPERRVRLQTLQVFASEHVEWKSKEKFNVRLIIGWYKKWRMNAAALVVKKKYADNVRTANGGFSIHGLDRRSKGGRALGRGNWCKTVARKADFERLRADGGGAHCKAAAVRRELYEWWSSMRHAIDWKKLANRRRSCGKRLLCRMPRSMLRLKVRQFLQEHATASLLCGKRVQTFDPCARWFARWEREYGLSMKYANRKYQVPCDLLQLRLHIFWLNLHRIRLFIFLKFGYWPTMENFDQSPFHNNETGSQDKPCLSLVGSNVPIVEGNVDVKMRWTANLTTFEDVDRILRGDLPYCELMLKAASDEDVCKRLKRYIRDQKFPKWFSVTTAPKGSYREADVLAFLDLHLEKMTPGRQWRIMLADDFSAHKTINVRRLCWSRGYVLVIHGGGATPVVQTPDTDLNEHVRKEYGEREGLMLLEKMRDGDVVPRMSPEECCDVMLDVLSDKAIHIRAAEGYKKVGQSIDARSSKQDALVVREARHFWLQETSDGFANVRAALEHHLRHLAAHPLRQPHLRRRERPVRARRARRRRRAPQPTDRGERGRVHRGGYAAWARRGSCSGVDLDDRYAQGMQA